MLAKLKQWLRIEPRPEDLAGCPLRPDPNHVENPETPIVENFEGTIRWGREARAGTYQITPAGGSWEIAPTPPLLTQNP